MATTDRLVVRYQTRAPLTHGAFDAEGGAGGGGNAMPLRRFPVLTERGPVSVPAVSGNALRGTIRRLVSRALFRRLGWMADGQTEAAASPPDGFDTAYLVLANGGLLEGWDKTVTPAQIDAIRTDCPPLSVLGSGMGDYFLPGRVSVGILWPVCDVTVAAGVVEPDAEAPPLADIEGETWHARLPDQTEQDAGQTGAKPMPHGFETLAVGVRLEAEVLFDPEATPAERGAVVRGLQLVQALGGRRAAGLGAVSLQGGADAAPPAWEAAYAAWLDAAGTPAAVARALCR